MATTMAANTANVKNQTTSNKNNQNNQFPVTTTTAATQLPNIDFDFEDLRQRMSAFTVKFDSFIERGQKRVLEERNEFRGRLGELAEDHRLKTSSITTLTSATTTQQSLQQREQDERQDMDASIRSLQATKATHTQTRDRLVSQIAATRRQIDDKLAAQRDYAEKLERQSRLNGPELGFWEAYLGVRLEGSGAAPGDGNGADGETIRVVFTFEGGKGQGKASGTKSGSSSGSGSGSGSRDDCEVWFDLDLSRRNYGVKAIGGGGLSEQQQQQQQQAREGRRGATSGMVSGRLRDRVDVVVDRLNESRDIGLFLAGMRALFVEELRG